MGEQLDNTQQWLYSGLADRVRLEESLPSWHGASCIPMKLDSSCSSLLPLICQEMPATLLTVQFIPEKKAVCLTVEKQQKAMQVILCLHRYR